MQFRTALRVVCACCLGCATGCDGLEPGSVPARPSRADASADAADAQTAHSMQPPAPAVDAGQPLDSTKEITSFSIAGVSATIGEDSIQLTVPHDTRLRNITPELAYRGAALAPRALAPQDFTKDVVYSVMAQDGSSRNYTVKVTVAANNNHGITHFRIFGIESSIDGSQIELTLPAGTDLTGLVPAITLSGGTVSPPSGAVQDFSKPVMYTVTGADGTTQSYTVHVTVGVGSANDIMSFDVPGAVTTFQGDTIELSAPFGTSSCNWTPSISHAGASIAPASGAAQNFLKPVTYTVTAGDGSQRSYAVSCDVAQTSARGIRSFEVLGLPATIIGDDITLTVPNAASLGALTPTISHYGVRVMPASGAAQSFYAPVSYSVLEADGTQHQYTVTIASADRSDNELVGLEYAGRAAAISGNQVTLTLPAGSDTHALAPTLLHRGARVIPLSGTTRDFSGTTALVYTVVARDGSRRDYMVSVVVAGKSDKELSKFALLGMPARAQGNELTLRLPYGTDLRALAPSRLEHTGASIAPPSAAIQDFSEPVSYTVTAADGSTQTYTVHASVSAADAGELQRFRILGSDAVVTDDLVQLQLPAATSLSALVPTLQTSALHVLPLSSLPQDFTSPVSYELTAADGSKHNYRVVIELLPP